MEKKELRPNIKQDPNASPGAFSNNSNTPENTLGGFRVGDDVYIQNFQFDIINGTGEFTVNKDSMMRKDHSDRKTVFTGKGT